MIGAVKILVISDDAEVCNLIHSAFEFEGNSAVCVSCPLEALQLLHRGLVANFLLIHATRNRSKENLFAAALLQNFSREKLCILAEAGDTSWKHHAAKWKIDTVLTMPLLRQDIEKLRTQPSFDTIAQRLETAGPASPAANTSVNVPHYHMEELDNNRFFLAASPIMMQLYRDVRLLAPVNVPVLILGESGVGKEIVAMLLHKYYPNPEGKFLNINCAALPTELLESELFGYEAGAFTGAARSKPGKFEQANNGTILLDELGEMSAPLQAKLLHVLQDGEFCRLGGRSNITADVRVLAATNIDMQKAIARKTFREDLYYRVNAFTLKIPPLRERREEVPFLLKHFMARFSEKYSQEPLAYSEALIDACERYHWPGNLRELGNFVKRYIVLRDEQFVVCELEQKNNAFLASRNGAKPDSKVNKVALSRTSSGLKSLVRNSTVRIELKALEEALEATHWNRKLAAARLNISYKALLNKLKRYEMVPPHRCGKAS